MEVAMAPGLAERSACAVDVGTADAPLVNHAAQVDAEAGEFADAREPRGQGRLRVLRRATREDRGRRAPDLLDVESPDPHAVSADAPHSGFSAGTRTTFPR